MYLNPITYSQLSTGIEAHLLIVDKIGILADLYKYAKLAYVGSGFTSGVHSVIEPAVYGCIIGHGPKFELLDEAKYMYQKRLSHLITSNSDMDKFIRLINNENESMIKDELNNYIIKSSGASNKIIKGIGL